MQQTGFKYLYFLLGMTERSLAVANQCGASLIAIERAFERKLAAFEALHQRFQFADCGLERFGSGDGGGSGWGLVG